MGTNGITREAIRQRAAQMGWTLSDTEVDRLLPALQRALPRIAALDDLVLADREPVVGFAMAEPKP